MVGIFERKLMKYSIGNPEVQENALTGILFIFAIYPVVSKYLT